MKKKVVVRRAAWVPFLMALAGIPALFLVADYALGVLGVFDLVGRWAYGGRDPEPFELRDDILAAILAMVGLGLVGFGIKDLVAPRKVFEADTEGIRLPLRGPLTRPVRLGWLQVTDLEASGRDLLVHLGNGGGIPPDPWGASWRGERTLVLSTRWWQWGPGPIIDEVARLRLPDETRARQEAMLLEEARAHAAALELVAGAAVMGDPTRDRDDPGETTPTRPETADPEPGDAATPD